MNGPGHDTQIDVTSGFFSVDGARLEYQLLCPRPAGELTLLLLHEGLGCVALWKDFPRQLARLTGCRVLAYSRAGYGGSAPCTLPRPLSFMHDEGLRVLPQLLDQAGLRRVVLLGHSDGASIAIINAGGVADARIAGLILLAPHVFVEDVTLASIRAAKTAYQSGDLRERLARYHGDNVDCAFWGWNRAWLDEGFRQWNLEQFLPTIQVPVLMLQGEADPYGTGLQLEKIARQVAPPTEVVLLPATGHAPFREQPERTLQAIDQFLQRHQLAAGPG